ncbi:MAG: hypothetical protein EP350_07020 [Alphaproteobacteria bacterium]|nr:MAG: hypothetical protein EP350_07020 [Alphaproteobacteria bacterium]
MKSIFRTIGFACAAASALALATPAAAQLTVWDDYTPQKEVTELTTVKVDEGQLDTYLAGLKDTWVKSNEIGKQLGQIVSYGIYVVPYGDNDVNLILRITYPNMAALEADKAEYDKFMAAWGKENSDKANKTVLEVYNKIREIKGTYMLRELKMNK